MKHGRIRDAVLASVTWFGAIVTFLVLSFMVGHLLFRGVGHITPSLFHLHYNSENVSVVPALVTTVLMTMLSLVIAVPFGVFSAIYLVEYASRGSKLVGLVRMTTETLSGIPSIVYGLFGLLFFVGNLGMGFSVLAGALTLSIMILPLVLRTTEEALKSVPDTYREGSYGLGAGKLRTVFQIVLPTAVPGVLAGVILAIGRIVGETAALIFTAGTVPQIPSGVTSSARTLAVHMYLLSSEGLHTDEAYATAVVLLFMVIGINALSAFLAKKVAR